MAIDPKLSKFLRRDYHAFDDAEVAEWMTENRMSADHAQLALDLMHLTVKKEIHSAFVPALRGKRLANISKLLKEGTNATV